jgi:hypothetical protein
LQYRITSPGSNPRFAVREIRSIGVPCAASCDPIRVHPDQGYSWGFARSNLRGRVLQFFSSAPRAPPLAICFSYADQFASLCSIVSNPEGDNFLVRQWIRRVFNSTDPSLSAAETVK